MDKLVFVIDDDPIYLKFMQNHFNLLGGFRTETYTTGEAALENLSKNPFLIILDHNFQESEKDGIYYLKEIKKKNSKVPVVYITSDTSMELPKRANQQGARGFIIKDSAFLVYLRTALDDIVNTAHQKNFLSKIFG